MEEELISVIVPIYKVEKYLKQCIDSIIDQTYNNIEIILVDDGSPDCSGEICDEYAKKDERIKVIHKKNGGLSDARNKGINEATGKYIAFIDSDDYIEPCYLEKLYHAIKKNGTKIAQCNIQKVDESNTVIETIGDKIKSEKDGKIMIKELYDNKWENIVVWNKLYVKQLFDNIRFPVGKLHEDEYTTYKVLYDIEKISIIPECLYCYRQRKESIIGKKFTLNRLDILEALEERLSYFQQKNEKELYYLTLQLYLQKIRESYLKVRLFIEESNLVQKELKKKYKKNYLKVIKAKEITFSTKMKGNLFYFIPDLWYVMKKRGENGERIIKENKNNSTY